MSLLMLLGDILASGPFQKAKPEGAETPTVDFSRSSIRMQTPFLKTLE
jgi:hypothetical protein